VVCFAPGRVGGGGVEGAGAHEALGVDRYTTLHMYTSKGTGWNARA